ncbi:class IV lanthionine synthetase LanL [Streptosporangium sp. KLBMP 9127]|nr:class IV lanthionine synthetase LanL [Streptosporangium sp. KLBMP 9127]
MAISFSVFATSPDDDSSDTALTDVLARALRALPDPRSWRSDRNGIWCRLGRNGSALRSQGWKLHVSATPASAAEVLTRSLTVLLGSRSAFKFAATIDHVATLTARNTARGHAGKFITVYPDTDAEAARLAGELHLATAGLAGPRILSDRPYTQGSLVHYRYGAFVEQRQLTNDGFYVWVITGPDGEPVEDQRLGRYTPPSWVACPFPDNGLGSAHGPQGGGVLLGDRFQVREAIRHTNKGGVYRALDTRTGDMVVIKEARPHIAADESGRDTCDLLRAEARALKAIEHLRLAPALVTLFTQSGHLFMAEEMIPGVTLRQWAHELIAELGWGPHLPQALALAGRLTESMTAAHEAGLVLRDFNPGNIMVRPDGSPVLIDLEMAAFDRDPAAGPLRGGTPGYGAPEQWAGAAPAVSADHYSLGATLCYLCTGAPVHLLPERPHARPLADRLTAWLAARADGALPPGLTRLLVGLMAEEPGRRWTASQARDVLAAQTPRRATHQDRRDTREIRRDAEPSGLREECARAVTGLTGYLIGAMDPKSERLWPGTCAHGAPDPLCVQHGAAGPLAVLARCFEHTGEPRVAEAIDVAGRWIAERLEAGERRPAGLYFGTAGAAWSLLEAGRALSDDRLVGTAVAVARALPASIPIPDITHGTAGVGLTALHLWRRTGEAFFAGRANAAADALIATADQRTEPLSWPAQPDYASRMTGKRLYGFAHGIAGVGYFLLACAQATGRADCLSLAGRVGDTLLTAATTGRTAMWGSGPGDEPTAPYWCHGSGGIAAFLVRLHQATGDERYAQFAGRSAQAVIDHFWRPVLGQCHGLAGNGDLLLDMAAMTGDDRYAAAAWRQARIILASGAHRDGNLVVPDDHADVSATWGDGVSGVLAFLLRLCHGSPRFWMADSAPTTQGHRR